MRRKSLRENSSLPLVQRHLPDAGGDVVPQCLDVVDLILDGEIVEALGRQWQSLWHGSHYTIDRSASQRTADRIAPGGICARFRSPSNHAGLSSRSLPGYCQLDV